MSLYHILVWMIVCESKDKSKKRRLNLSGSCQDGTLQLTIPLSCQVVYKGFVTSDV